MNGQDDGNLSGAAEGQAGYGELKRVVKMNDIGDKLSQAFYNLSVRPQGKALADAERVAVRAKSLHDQVRTI